jgi:Pregnancy-associated plasma protein-A
MKNLISVFLLLFLVVNLHAQTELPCGYKVDDVYYELRKDPKSAPNKRLQFLKSLPLKEVYEIEAIDLINGKYEVLSDDKPEDGSASDKTSIPVVVHNVRRDDGSGGMTDAEIIGMIETLNERYDGFGFHFVLCAIRAINNNTIYKTEFKGDADDNQSSGASYTVLDVTNRNVRGKINFYIVPTADASWAWRPSTNPLKQHILLQQEQARNSSTVAHEVGHWFGLLHTHGKKDSRADELVDGSNCETAGDLICDTPADPNLIGRVNSSTCNYAPGNLAPRDANGQLYAPETNNYMSYSRSQCRNRFSDDQVYIMHETYIGLESYRGYKLSNCGTQLGWRWCVKCQALFFTGDGQDSGVCPAGQKHTPNPTATDTRRSGNYIVDRGEANGPNQQDGWRWCNKCQGLFHTDDLTDVGICPAGYQHTLNANANDSRRSGLYSLDCRQAANPPSTGQQKWRQCGKCHGLFFSSDGEASGVCPGQGKHEPNGKKDTVNHYAVKRQ